MALEIIITLEAHSTRYATKIFGTLWEKCEFRCIKTNIHTCNIAILTELPIKVWFSVFLNVHQGYDPISSQNQKQFVIIFLSLEQWSFLSPLFFLVLSWSSDYILIDYRELDDHEHDQLDRRYEKKSQK